MNLLTALLKGALIVLIALTLYALVLSSLIWISSYVQAQELDDPIIATEIIGRRDSITTGVVGNNALNLYRFNGPRGGQTIGTLGDRVILIDHVPGSSLENRYEPETQSFSTLSSYGKWASEELSDLQSEEE